jgi:hypothetical protein
MSIEVIETHTILPDMISQGPVVIDCGANVGRFSLEMIRRFGCVCYAIEAAPETFGKIPNEANLYRYNFALCGANKLVMMLAAAILDLQTRARSCQKLLVVRSWAASCWRRRLVLGAPGGQQAAGYNRCRNVETATK